MKFRFVKPVYAHCDLPCGVYDPAQARIEAQSVYEMQKKYSGLDEKIDSSFIYNRPTGPI